VYLSARKSKQAGVGLKKLFRQGMVWRVLGTLVSLALLIYLVAAQGWDIFFQTMRELPLLSFLLALVLILFSRLFVSLRWYILLRSADLPIGFLACLRLVFMGLFASNFLPSTVGGDLVRIAGAVYLRMNSAVVAASLLVDRLIGMAGMALLLPVGLAAMAAPASGVSSTAPSAMAAGLVSIPGLRWAGTRLVNFIRSLLQSSVYWLRHPASLGWAFLFTFGHMLVTFLAISVLLSGMRQPLTLLWIGGLWSFSYFISLAPFSINGLGLQEVSIAYLYSHFGGVSMETGLALAVLLRMLFLLASLPGALFLPEILRPMPR
jgi:glycosyltransferase 2 family protein